MSIALHRPVTLVVWFAVGFTVVGWGLRGWPEAPVPSQALAPQASTPTPSMAQVMRGFGGAPAPAAAVAQTSVYRLMGVLAGGPHQGAALIAQEGQAPKPYKVGQSVAPGLVLQSVVGREARLGPSQEAPPSLTLSLPAKP
jgi:general secretion pathway protein C